MPRRGGRRKKRHTDKPVDISEREKQLTPKCLVLKRGKVGLRVQGLVQDFREVMLPNCARKLRESKLNRIEDFTAIAGDLGVSHLLIFTASKRHTWMKFAKLPQGPTLTFQVDSFTLASDIRATQKRPGTGPRDLLSAPLQVLNGFAGGSDQSGMKKLTVEMLRGMFPAVDVPSFNQSECRRTALFNYDSEKDVIQFRHFTVARKPVGLQRGVSKLLKPTRLPQLGRCEDVADYILGGGLGGASESEVEDLQEVPISGASGRTAVRLVERGPRLSLTLVKAEEGVCNGGVLYHRYSTKTPSQIEIYEEKARQRRKLRERNEMLEARSNKVKAKRREVEKRKRVAEEGEEGGGEEIEPDADGFVRGAPRSEDRPNKKKRFHPFSWGKKKEKEKEGKKPAGGAGGAGGDRKEQRQKSVLDRFHKSRRTGEA